LLNPQLIFIGENNNFPHRELVVSPVSGMVFDVPESMIGIVSCWEQIKSDTDSSMSCGIGIGFCGVF
jgi:hypothetical protein